MVIDKGAVRGGCMPSSHFGVALVLTMYNIRYFRRWSWIMIFLTLGLAIGTVWGRFHYVSDVIVGGLIGLIVTLSMWKYDSRQKAVSYSENSKFEVKTHHVT
jgi:membrane-associated phospholipid phosphatase